MGNKKKYNTAISEAKLRQHNTDLEKAQKLLKYKHYKEALEILQRLHKQAPEDSEIIYEYARALTKNAKTRKYAKEMLLTIKNRADARLVLAKLEKEAGNIEMAQKYLLELLDTRSRYYAMNDLGFLEMHAGNYEDAEIWFSNIVEEIDDCVGWKGLIFLQIHQENYEKAYELYQKAVTTNSDLEKELTEIGIFLRYKMDILTEQDTTEKRGYFRKQMLSYNENLVKRIIRNHTTELPGKDIHSTFYEEINIEKLFRQIKGILINNDIEPVSFSVVDKYIFNFPNMIGKLNGEKTNQLQVSTIANTKQIITMYPDIEPDQGIDIEQFQKLKIKKTKVKERKLSQIEKFHQKYGMR